MKVKDILNNEQLTLVNEGDLERVINSVYCCDMLSVVMSRAPSDCAWVTVMGNVNAVAVSVLTDMSVIIIADNAVPDEAMLQKAKSENINVFKTSLPVFETASLINSGLKQN
mgnify:CR=1 FL=1